MKICDPIHGYIQFNKEERLLISNPFLQRLRWIQQLGFVHYAFPAGVSNRYIHSLGACDLAGRVFDSIFSKENIKKLNINPKKQEEFRRLVKAAALLHDIGHGPLSHTSECFMPQLKDLNISSIFSTRQKARHEDYTVKIILESSLKTDLENVGVHLLSLIHLVHSEVKSDESFFTEKGMNFLPLLKQIISSDLDVDRMDYLQRDSYFCGVKYGEFDFNWMISEFDAYIEKDSVYLALNREALCTAENFLLSRYYMHSTVYHHHKPVIYEQMLKKALEGWILPLNIKDYIEIVDRNVFNRLKEIPDNEWAHRILNQNPYECLYEFFSEENRSEQIKQILDKNKIPYLETHSLRNAMKPAHRVSNTYPIFIKTSCSKDVTHLSKQTEFLLKHHVQSIDRIYVPPENFEKTKKLVL